MINAQQRVLRGQNENGTTNGGPVAAKRVLPQRGARAALGDVGNRTRQFAGGVVGKPNDDSAPLKPGLKKQRAVSNLRLHQENVAPSGPGPVTRRKSAETQPMEVVEVEKSPQVDVEMQDAHVPESTVDAQVEDIDVEDRSEPQLCAEYVNEIYAYLRKLEVEQAVRENYLESVAVPAGGKVMIKPKMRNLLVDWLVEVHGQFNLLQETLCLTTGILDRFLQQEAGNITTKQLQLVGVTAMFLASKYEEMYPPDISDFVYITDKAYTEAQIRQMEILMIKCLDFDLGRPLPINFLRRNSKAAQVDAKTHQLAKYAMELTLVDYKMAHIPPSVIAASCLAFSMKVWNPRTSLHSLWTPTLAHYTTYQIEDIMDTLADVAKLVMAVNKDLSQSPAAATSGGNKKKALLAVTKKYSHKKNNKIATIPELEGDIVAEMAQGAF